MLMRMTCVERERYGREKWGDEEKVNEYQFLETISRTHLLRDAEVNLGHPEHLGGWLGKGIKLISDVEFM